MLWLHAHTQMTVEWLDWSSSMWREAATALIKNPAAAVLPTPAALAPSPSAAAATTQLSRWLGVSEAAGAARAGSSNLKAQRRCLQVLVWHNLNPMLKLACPTMDCSALLSSYPNLQNWIPISVSESVVWGQNHTSTTTKTVVVVLAGTNAASMIGLSSFAASAWKTMQKIRWCFDG